jgi:hypothetical protein
MHRGTQAGGRRAAAVLALLALALAALPSLVPVAMANHTDDYPETGRWAEDGATFRDWVQLSADDPSADPVDWYRVNLTAEGALVDMLRVDVNLTAGGGQEQYFVWASIHDPDEALLQEVKAPGYARKTTQVAAQRTGVHLVRVYTYSRFPCNYLISFNITSTANTSDGDNLLSQARFLEPPESATGHVDGRFDTFDHYAVNLTRDATSYDLLDVRLYPEMERPAQDLDLFLIMLDTNGTPREVASSTSNGSTEATFYAAEDANVTIYIRVHAYGGSTNYTVLVRRYSVPDDGNNNMARAEELAQNASHEDSLNLTDPRDFYMVNLTGGDMLAVTVLCHDYDPVARKPNFDLYVLDPTGTIVNWSFMFDPLEHASYIVPAGAAAAWYYPLVTFHDRTPFDGVPAWGNYTINITVDHAPQVLIQMPLPMDEDVPIDIALEGLLGDPDGPLGAVHLVRATNVTATVHGGRLSVTPAEDGWGDAEVVLSVASASRLVEVVIPIAIAPAQDAPRLVEPAPSLVLDEDTTLRVDLATLFLDPDGDALSYTLGANPGGPLAGSSLEGAVLTVVPAPDFYGEGSLDVTASDGTASKTARLSVTVAPVPDAPRVVWADPNVTAPEDSRGIELDLATVFGDADGEGLSYTPSGGEHLSYIVLGDRLVADAERDFSGTTSLTVVARDAAGAEATATVLFVIVPVNDPPEVTFQDPAARVTAEEGGSVIFTVSAHDPEGTTVIYAWFLDGEPLAETLPRLGLDLDHGSAGGHVVSARASDGELVTWANWTLEVANVNRAPTVRIERPEQGQSFGEGANVVLEAVVTDPDGEGARVVWRIDGEVVGEGAVLTTSDIAAGEHLLEVTATDPYGANATASIEFKVDEGEGIPGATAAFAVVCIAATAAIAYLAAGGDRRSRGA